MSKLEGYCIKFAITLGKLTAKLKKEKPITYDVVVFDEQVIQYNKGFRLHRINKPNSSGTKMTFKAIETEEELKEVSDFLNAERERLLEIMKENLHTR